MANFLLKNLRWFPNSSFFASLEQSLLWAGGRLIPISEEEEHDRDCVWQNLAWRNSAKVTNFVELPITVWICILVLITYSCKCRKNLCENPGWNDGTIWIRGLSEWCWKISVHYSILFALWVEWIGMCKKMAKLNLCFKTKVLGTWNKDLWPIDLGTWLVLWLSSLWDLGPRYWGIRTYDQLT